MVKIIVVTFAFLAVALYELSGGADFEPASARMANMKTDPLKPSEVLKKPAEVTRVALDLSNVTEIPTTPRTDRVRLPQKEVVGTPQPILASAAGLRGADKAVLPSLVAGVDPNPIQAPVKVAAAVSEPREDVQEALPATLYTELREVSGARVNVRGGPGTTYNVVGRLVRGDRVEVLEDTGDGWVRFRAMDSDTSGWVADFLLASN
ncbi:MAG: SH3 domain-containing protein [Paracoccaceae bacterium]